MVTTTTKTIHGEALKALQAAMVVISQHYPENATCCKDKIKLIQDTIGYIKAC